MFKIGEVAKKTGVSVRSLRHYDSIGLLAPSFHSEARYRLYSKSDLIQLQKVVSLKQMGFSLQAIKTILRDDAISLQKTMQMHLIYIQEKLAQQQQIYQQIKHVCDLINARKKVSIDTICQTVESIKMLEKYYSQEQLEALKKRSFHLDEKKAQEYDDAWYEIFDGLSSFQKQGIAAYDSKTKPFVIKAQKMLALFTQGDVGIEQSLERMYSDEGGGQMLRNHGLDVSDELFEYYKQAWNAHLS
jgi:DNA-binding transcriptional MerR regulator